MLLFTMRWARLIPIDRKAFIWTTTLKPTLFLSPVICYVIVSLHRSVSTIAVTLCVLYTTAVAAGQFRSLRTVPIPLEVGGSHGTTKNQISNFGGLLVNIVAGRAVISFQRVPSPLVFRI